MFAKFGAIDMLDPDNFGLRLRRTDQQRDNPEAVCELESTGGKSTGICMGCTVAGRHSIAELEVK